MRISVWRLTTVCLAMIIGLATAMMTAVPAQSLTPAVQAPGAPTDVAVVAGNGTIDVSWTAPADNGGADITGYDVQYSDDSGATWTSAPAAFAGDTATSRLISGVTNGVDYRIQVAATNASATGDYTQAPTTARPHTVPDAPTIVQTTPGNGQIALSWTAPADNGGADITGYDVQYSGDSGTTWTPAPHTGIGTSQTLTGLTNGTDYLVRVAAINQAGNGNYAQSTARPRPDVPGAPTGVQGDAGNAAVTLSWTAPVDDGGAAITGYDVQYSANAGASWVDVPAMSGTTPGRVVSGLNNGTAYIFRVAASNSAGTGADSTASSAVTPRASTPPARPTGVAATAGKGQAVVTWIAPADVGSEPIAGYDVQVSRAGGVWTSASAAFHTSTAVGQTITGLRGGDSYRFRVAAINAAGTGDYSTASAPVRPRAALHLTNLTTTATGSLTFGRVATLTATLTDITTRTRVARAALALRARVNGGSWQWVADATTRSNGTATVRVRPARTTQYAWTYGGTSGAATTLASVRGAARTVAVAATVSAKFAHAKVKAKHRVVFAGVVRPGNAGDVVRLELTDGRQWWDTGITARTSAAGKYRIEFVVAGRGRYLLRVRHAATTYHITSVSPARRLRIT